MSQSVEIRSDQPVVSKSELLSKDWKPSEPLIDQSVPNGSASLSCGPAPRGDAAMRDAPPRLAARFSQIWAEARPRLVQDTEELVARTERIVRLAKLARMVAVLEASK